MGFPFGTLQSQKFLIKNSYARVLKKIQLMFSTKICLKKNLQKIETGNYRGKGGRNFFWQGFSTPVKIKSRFCQKL
jgi:hypothetical protein